jgi:hypothetical protein
LEEGFAEKELEVEKLRKKVRLLKEEVKGKTLFFGLEGCLVFFGT